MKQGQPVNSINSVTLLCKDLKRKFLAPTKSFTFYTHLVLAIIAGGGLGIWDALYQSKHAATWNLLAISAALYTYFPAIVATALVEFTHEKQPYMRSFGLFSLAPFSLLFFLAITTEPEFRLAWAIFASIASILFWWVANGEKDFFRDVLTPEDAYGGDVKRDVIGQGSEGWKE